jgi:catechol 2,3-dioxygenase-like lactoylglutathione lyase family enzyme
MSNPGTKRIHHLGIVVADLDQAERFATEVLGFELGIASTTADGTKIRFCQVGDVTFELLELPPGEGRTARLGDAPARLDHVALQVGDLDAALTALKGSGVGFVQGIGGQPTDKPSYSPLSGARHIFSDPGTTEGVVYQFIQPTD